MKTLILIIIIISTGCGSTSLWMPSGDHSQWDSDPWRNDKRFTKDFFIQEKNWSRGEYIPDRWEAELKYNAGIMSRKEFNHYERVRSVYPHKDLRYIDENGYLRTPDVKISPDGRRMRIRETPADPY